MSRKWPEEVEDVLSGDAVVALAYATPARGVVVLPVTNFGLHDPEAGTVSVNTSVGVPRKLERIRREPRVALAFHTRRHSRSDRREYVLVQGRARLGAPVPDYPSTVLGHWERFEPWDMNRLWKRWRRFYALRLEIEVHAERVIVWPDLQCEDDPVVHGRPLPDHRPEPQPPPGRGTAPRLDARRAAHRAARLPHVLLGWIGPDGFPVVVPVGVSGADDHGMLLDVPAGLVPAGGRRAGLTAHSFSADVTGQHQRKHTGWLEPRPERRAVYAPHTLSAYRLPPSRFVYRFVTGFATRRGVRAARRAGFLN